jgi:hypothetical protein
MYEVYVCMKFMYVWMYGCVADYLNNGLEVTAIEDIRVRCAWLTLT